MFVDEILERKLRMLNEDEEGPKCHGGRGIERGCGGGGWHLDSMIKNATN